MVDFAIFSSVVWNACCIHCAGPLQVYQDIGELVPRVGMTEVGPFQDKEQRSEGSSRISNQSALGKSRRDGINPGELLESLQVTIHSSTEFVTIVHRTKLGLMVRHPTCNFTGSSNLARSSPPTVWQRRGFVPYTAYRQRQRGAGKGLPSRTFLRAPQSCSLRRNQYPRGALLVSA